MEEIRDDADEFFASIGQEIQDYEVPESPISEEYPADEAPEESVSRPYGDVPDVTSADVRKVENMRAIKRPSAEVIVGVMDVLLPLLITFLIKGCETEDCKLTQDEHDTLVLAWATYLGDKNVAMSPGVALVASILTIYGAKLIGAIQSSKEREELARLSAENVRLRQQLDGLDSNTKN